MMTGEFPELQDRFRIISRISRGTFSVVYLGEALNGSQPGQKFALKRIVQTSSPERVAKEMRIMMQIAGRSHICPLLDAFRYRDQVTLVLPYFQHDQFRSYYAEMSVDEVRLYLKALFESLQLIHTLGIIHRDIKPSNFLYNRSERKFLLIDFGLAQQVDELQCIEHGKATRSVISKVCSKKPRPELKGKPNMRTSLPSVPRAGTRGYRAPEVLFLTPNQTTAIDVWSVGSIMLSIACKRYPFFESNDDLSALAEIAHVLGSKQMHSAAAALNRSITLPERIPKRPLRELCLLMSGRAQDDLSEEFFDLLERCLDPIPSKRISALEALRHPFLKPQEPDNVIMGESILSESTQPKTIEGDVNHYRRKASAAEPLQ